jgi:hypothetical protein
MQSASPRDSMFRLTRAEVARLRSQIAMSNATGNRSQIATGSAKHRDPRLLPYAFTEHGALMRRTVAVLWFARRQARYNL